MSFILIVDDKEENLYYLQSLLTGHGCKVETARHGAEALVKARQHLPDLIISDLLMSVMDGYTLLRHWKADPRLKIIPFIVYTATYTEPEDERLALSLGADAFLLKPLGPEELLARIREVEARAANPGSLPPHQPAAAETELLKAYSETLIRKLEEKTLQLEETNRALEQDIAERNLALNLLRESEERFRGLAETIQEVFWMTDPLKEQLLYISPAYEKIWGRTCSGLYESPGTWLDAIHPDDRERVRHAAATKQGLGNYDETYRIHRPDGAIRWIHDRAFPVRDAAGKVVRIVGTAEDITDRRQLEEQFYQSQKMEAVGRLAAGMAHDFNNILAAIVGNAELARDEVGPAHPAQESLEEIRQAGHRAKDLVRQILAFSRQQPQERRILSLGPVIEEGSRLLRATLPANVELVTFVAQDTPNVLADITQLHQILLNFGTNAWHALRDHPGRIEIRLEAATLEAATGRLASLRPGLFACLSVSDTGQGMDAATLARIFEPFFTTKEVGQGTGLGLSIVHAIVQSHDGAITVQSQPGRGATFQVYLPAVESAASAPAASDPTVLHGRGQRILFLDDEEPLVYLAERMLRQLHYHVTGFTSPAEALKAFRDDPTQFDLFITDLNMPSSSGLSVAAEVLKIRPELPIVLASGYITDDLKNKAHQLGIRHILYKPTTLREFGDQIYQLVSGHRPA